MTVSCATGGRLGRVGDTLISSLLIVPHRVIAVQVVTPGGGSYVRNPTSNHKVLGLSDGEKLKFVASSYRCCDRTSCEIKPFQHFFTNSGFDLQSPPNKEAQRVQLLKQLDCILDLVDLAHVAARPFDPQL